jgi:hypothetical protein
MTQPSGRHAILSVYLLQIRAAKTAGFHPYKNVPIAGHLRIANFVNRDGVRAFYKYGLHASMNLTTRYKQ